MRRIYIGLLMLELTVVADVLWFLFNPLVEDDTDNPDCRSCPESAWFLKKY
jgi:hypothetical protein